jgi:hypothetical protein
MVQGCPMPFSANRKANILNVTPAARLKEAAEKLLWKLN